MTEEGRTCPNCDSTHVVKLDFQYFCLHCGYKWPPVPPLDTDKAIQIEEVVS